MAETRKKPGGGILLRGPDGNLYFISARELRKHKLSSSQHRCLEACLQQKLIECIQSCSVSSSDSVSASDSVLIPSGSAAARRGAK